MQIKKTSLNQIMKYTTSQQNAELPSTALANISTKNQCQNAIMHSAITQTKDNYKLIETIDIMDD